MTNTVQINLKEYFYDKTTLDRDFAKKSDIPTLSNLGGVVNVVKQQEAETGYASTYYVTQDGTQVGSKINIPKDFLVRSASIKTVTTANEPQQGFEVDDKYLDFVINVADDSADNTHIYVNVRDLFNEYQAGTGLTLSNNTFSITPGTIPTDVSDLTDTEDTEFTPKGHNHGYINNLGQILKPGSSMPTTTRSGVVVTNNNGEAVSSQYLPVNKIQDSTVHTHIGSAENATQDVINAAIDTKFDNINTAISTINNAGYITASEANLNNYYTKTQVDEMNCGTFTELQSLITPANPNDVIILNKDYKYNALTDGSLVEGIVIDKNLTIIGNGHVLDGNKNARIFILDIGESDAEITASFTGLHFINGKGDDKIDGGAISSQRFNILKISNCSFNNNDAGSNGGAIYIAGAESDFSTITKCIFNNNSSDSYGGAILCSATEIIDCTFYNNDTYAGGAIDIDGSKLLYCTFYNNTANRGGAIYCESQLNDISNCIFGFNTATYLAHDVYCDSNLIIYNCRLLSSGTLYHTTNKPYLTDHQDVSNKLEFSDLDDMIGLSYDNSTGILSLTFTDPNNNS